MWPAACPAAGPQGLLSLLLLLLLLPLPLHGHAWYAHDQPAGS
jgi:hypothetical protein